MVSRAKRAARAAAKRVPLVGTAVVLVPAFQAAGDTLNMSNIASGVAWKNFFIRVAENYTGVNMGTGQIDGSRLAKTYVPIAVYLIARRFAGRHISRVFRPLHLKF